MFTDIVGYTSLSQRNETLMLELLDEHRRILRSIFPKYDAHEIEIIGDAFLVEFDSALRGVRCAIEIQQAMHRRNADQPVERRIQLRIGLHLGEVVHMGENVHGDGVNIAARVHSLAPPEGVVVSEDVWRATKIHPELSFVALGARRLKGVNTAIKVFAIKGEGLMIPSLRERVTSLPLFKNLAWVAAIVVTAAVGIYLFMPPVRPASASSKTIAVLPFSNMSGSPDDEYFSDGITEDILTQLAKIGDLKVISRTTMMQYKGTKKALKEIGKELNAGVVLEGSVRRLADQVRITAQLIDADTDEHLWAETYDKEFKQVFAIQSDVAQKIAVALKATLSPVEKGRIEKKPTTSTEAYTLYLKGKYLVQKATPEELAKGYELLNQAIKLDSNFALAYLGIALYYAVSTDFWIAPSVAMPELKKAVTKALEIDNRLPLGHIWLGYYELSYDWDWKSAQEELRMAADLGPQEYLAHVFYSWFFVAQGQFSDAMEHGRQMLEVEPLSPEGNVFYALIFYYARRYDEASAHLQKTLDLDQNYPLTRLVLGWCYVQQGKLAVAVAETRKAHELLASPWSLARLGYMYARAGDKKEALATLDSLREQSTKVYVPSDGVASIYVALGDRDRAFEYLEKAVEERAGQMLFLKVDPIWDPLRTDVRFATLLQKMGLDR